MEPTDRDIAKAALYDSIRPEVRRMAHQMESKFRLHDKERGDPFQPTSFEFLNARLVEEIGEMYKAMGISFVLDCGIDTTGKRPSEVWREAADGCNFLLMMAIAYEKAWESASHEVRECPR